MLLVGSQALKHYIDIGRTPRDTDFICTLGQMSNWMKHLDKKVVLSIPRSGAKYWHVRTEDGHNYEFELAKPATEETPANTAWKILNEYGLTEDDMCKPIIPIIEDLYAIKMAHRFKKNSPHFLKTRKDIMMMREYLIGQGMNPYDVLDIYPGFFKDREKESYNYSHPKLVGVTKEEFFTDSVPYVYDHDTIHLTVALDWEHNSTHVWPKPAYTNYMEDGAQVNTSSEKFFKCDEEVRLFGVYEESCVLALERSQIPSGFTEDPRKSFLIALEKVCTSITSGWFRAYAWENYEKVLDIYAEEGDDGYVKRFKANQHMLKPFKA